MAEPVREIAKDPENAYRYTGGQFGGGDPNGSAILGLGNLGPLRQAGYGGQVRPI